MALRSDRFPAIMLLAAAGAGLVVAGSPIGPAVQRLKDAPLGVPPLRLDAGDWISEGLLAVFFFVVAVELRDELTRGELNSVRRALPPAIAAAGGIVVPISLYLVIAGGSNAARGWPIPTATDIAFALGVLAVFGRGIPPSLRVFLLALAILDDIVGIVLIAVLFATDIDLAPLAAAVLAIVAFGALSRMLAARARVPVAVVLVLLAVTAWVLVFLSGVHPTIAGVALGLAMAPRPALRLRRAMEPWINAIVLPVFAFSAALVTIPQVAPRDLSPALWGILVALPAGKVIGIAGAGWLSVRLARRGSAPPLAFGDLLAAGALGGIGFTVSLLLAELAFEGDQATRDQATLGVLAGSLVSLVLAALLVSWRARHHTRAAIGPTTRSGPG